MQTKFLLIGLLIAGSFSAKAQNTPGAIFTNPTINPAKNHYVKTGVYGYPEADAEEKNGQVIINRIYAKNPEESPLKKGDIVLSYGELSITNMKDWILALQHYKPEEKIEIKVQRKDKIVTVPVQLSKIDVYGALQ